MLKYLEGWSAWESVWDSIYGLNYPYAIVFGKQREMLRIGIARHPDVVGMINQKAIRIALPMEMTARQMAKEINERLIPRVMKKTMELTMDGFIALTHGKELWQERIEKWQT